MPAIPPRRSTDTPDPRRPRRGRRTLLVALVFLMCMIVADGLFGERGLVALVRTQHQQQALAAHVSRAKASNDRLREEVRRLREDPAAVEELARRELGLLKPGEKLFIIRDVPPASQAR